MNASSQNQPSGSRWPGALLIAIGCGLNRFALGRALAPDGVIENALGQRIILGGQVLVLLAGILLLWFGPRLTSRRWAFVPLALAALVVATLNARLLLPVPESLQRMARMERSELLYLATVPRLSPLNEAALNLDFPGGAAAPLFQSTLSLESDLTAAEPERNGAGDVASANWPIEARARRTESRKAEMWKPFFASTRYLKRAGFAIVLARFLDDDEKRWQTEIHFSGLARMKDGAHTQIDADLDAEWERVDSIADPLAEGAWRIASLRTRSFNLSETSAPFFVESAAAMLPDPGDRQRALTSLHDKYVVENFRNKTKPHEYFTYQDLDRHPGLAVVDIDQDGLDDLYVAGEFGKNMLLRNQGDGTFRDVAPERGLDVDGFSSSAIFADLDNDGDPDLILGRTLERSLYLVNEGGRFSDRSQALAGTTLPNLVSSVSVGDYDHDGLLDVYFARYAAEMFNRPGTPERFLEPDQLIEYRRRFKSESHWLQSRVGPPSVLLRNAGGGRLEISPVAKEVEVWRNSYQATWSDYDRDGFVDLLVVNDFGHNNLFRNDGKGHFHDVTQHIGTTDLGFGMGASFGDYDNDGAPDLYVSNMYSKAGRRVLGNVGAVGDEFAALVRGNSLFRRTGRGFERVSGQKPPALQVERAGWSWGSQFVDLNNDGFLDVFALSGYYTAPKEIAIPVDT